MKQIVCVLLVLCFITGLTGASECGPGSEEPDSSSVLTGEDEAALFEYGDIVKVANTGKAGLYVRDAPAGTVIMTVPEGWKFRVIGGPQSALLGNSIYNWWQVREEAYEPYPDEGWVAEDYLSPTDLVPSDFSSNEGAIEEAIEWAVDADRINESQWKNRCLKFVARAFGKESAGYKNPNELKNSLGGKFFSTYNCYNPPRGALIFFSGQGEDPVAEINYETTGHIGIYLGNGKVVHAYKLKTSTDYVREENISDVEKLPTIVSYIGWAYPPEEWLSLPTPAPTVSDIVLVMDMSGSMGDWWNGEEKLSAAKKAAEALINSISLGSRVAVTTFNNTAQTLVHLTSDFSVARVAIEELYSGGNTNIGDALDKALNELEINSGTDNKKIIIFFTDGHITTGMGEDEVLAGPINEAISENVVVYAIGYGDPAYLCRDFLKKMAETTGGAYYDATEAFQLQNVFIEAGQRAEGWEIETTFAGTVESQETVTAGTFDLTSRLGSLKFILNWPGSDLDLKIFDPKGRELDYSDPNVAYSGDTKPEYVVINDPLSGTWTLKVYGKTVISMTEYCLWVTTYTSTHTSSSFIPFIALVVGIALVAAFLIRPRISRRTASRRHISRTQKVKGEIKMAKKQTQITVPSFTLTGKSWVVIGVIVALLLLVLGIGAGWPGVALTGCCVMSIALFLGGFLLSEEITPVRVTLLVLGGILLVSLAYAGITGATIAAMF